MARSIELQRVRFSQNRSVKMLTEPARAGLRFVPVVCLSNLLLIACVAQDPGDRERKAYDEIYASQPNTFLAQPNAFLMRMMSGRKPGDALDVGMGQGRNSIWLAEKGWNVTGFDISPVAVEQAKQEAQRRHLSVQAIVAPYESFDWGKDKWDLIVFSYFFPQSALPLVRDSLRPGGLILIEGFHADTARVRPIGGGYTDRQMFETLRDYRILQYEDVEDKQEWGRQFGETNRLVRVMAQKPVVLPPGCLWEHKKYRGGESMCWGVGQWSCGPQGWERSGTCSRTK